MSSSLMEKVRSDLNQARKQQDKLRTQVLTMTLSELHNRRIEAGQDLSEDEVLQALAKSIKRRNEASEQFRAAGRTELAAKEEAEAGILQQYLPQPLTEDEVRTFVREAIAQGASKMGDVMKTVSPRVRGRFDGKRLSQIVQEMLAV